MMMIEGILSIIEGEAPKEIEQKLSIIPSSQGTTSFHRRK